MDASEPSLEAAAESDMFYNPFELTVDSASSSATVSLSKSGADVIETGSDAGDPLASSSSSLVYVPTDKKMLEEIVPKVGQSFSRVQSDSPDFAMEEQDDEGNEEEEMEVGEEQAEGIDDEEEMEKRKHDDEEKKSKDSRKAKKMQEEENEKLENGTGSGDVGKTETKSSNEEVNNDMIDEPLSHYQVIEPYSPTFSAPSTSFTYVPMDKKKLEKKLREKDELTKQQQQTQEQTQQPTEKAPTQGKTSPPLTYIPMDKKKLEAKLREKDAETKKKSKKGKSKSSKKEEAPALSYVPMDKRELQERLKKTSKMASDGSWTLQPLNMVATSSSSSSSTSSTPTKEPPQIRTVPLSPEKPVDVEAPSSTTSLAELPSSTSSPSASSTRDGASSQVEKESRNISHSIVSKIVVQLLNPYFAKNAIASKELFKSLARALTHKVVEKYVGDGFRLAEDAVLDAAAKQLVVDSVHRGIKTYFAGKATIKTEADIKASVFVFT